ncbi:MAG: TlpA family protein disulfide reductase [Clostridia bacterium]|nr:TlpA family protein disulfide reductase [Clostridia bacterium]
MSSQVKAIVSVGVLALLIAGALLGYNALSSHERESAQPTQTRPPMGSQPAQPEQTSLPADNIPRAKDFTVTDTEGNAIALYEILDAGKPVIINFWATWCPPCVGEMPDIQKVFEKRGEDVAFMMVNLTRSDTQAAAQRFIADGGYTFPVYFDTKGTAAAAYGVSVIPQTFFIDVDGKIVQRITGAVENEDALLAGIALFS